MLIKIQDLEHEPIDFKELFQPGVIDLAPDFQQRAPLTTEGRAQLVEEQLGRHESLKDIRINGELRTSLELACARCLDPVQHDLQHNFDLLYRPQGADAGREELSVTAAEAEVSYYQGDGLLLEDVLREQILLAVPVKVICRDDCKGLCPQCGTNLNQEQCSCDTPVADARWLALKDLRDKLSTGQN
jgi:uncharacterized protein